MISLQSEYQMSAIVSFILREGRAKRLEKVCSAVTLLIYGC